MTPSLTPSDQLIACPTCDALHEQIQHEKLTCGRCHTVLSVPERALGVRVLLVTLVSACLIYGAIVLPFLSVERFWLSNDTTLIEAAFAFEGPLLALSLSILVLVLVLPAARLAISLYVLGPLILGLNALPGAATAFRWSEALRPWSMAEIFIIGCGVALVKIVALAEVAFGPAFYMFAAAVVLIWVQDRMVCRASLWRAIEK